jgi:hypothetical protein
MDYNNTARTGAIAGYSLGQVCQDGYHEGAVVHGRKSQAAVEAMNDFRIEVRRFSGIKRKAITKIQAVERDMDQCSGSRMAKVLVAGTEYTVNLGCRGCRKQESCFERYQVSAQCGEHAYPASLAKVRGQ